jgi:hypothetical protein
MVLFLGNGNMQASGKLVNCHEARVVAGAFVLSARVAEPDDDFHSIPGEQRT